MSIGSGTVLNTFFVALFILPCSDFFLNVFLFGWEDSLPIPQTNKVAIAVEIEIDTVNGMQKLRSDVLNERFELELNEKLLASKHGRFQVRLDKTYFCEDYEKQLLYQSKLTQHQRVTFAEMQLCQDWGDL